MHKTILYEIYQGNQFGLISQEVGTADLLIMFQRLQTEGRVSAKAVFDIQAIIHMLTKEAQEAGKKDDEEHPWNFFLEEEEPISSTSNGHKHSSEKYLWEKPRTKQGGSKLVVFREVDGIKRGTAIYYESDDFYF
eukprot:512650_1